jgi:predicted lipid-binding transport protein (Tim44 family)
MMYGPGYGFNPMGHVFGMLAAGFAGFVAFLIVAAVLVLLVRFLIIGTRAAQLYIANNSPAKDAPIVQAPPAPPVPPAPAAPTAPKKR